MESARNTTRNGTLFEADEGPQKVTRHGLRDLLKSQGYCCGLTGRKLSPQTASLDHIVPVGRGGRHDMSNLQVLDVCVNAAKGTLTQAEFISICRDVVAHIDRTP